MMAQQVLMFHQSFCTGAPKVVTAAATQREAPDRTVSLYFSELTVYRFWALKSCSRDRHAVYNQIVPLT
ncbi:hypothetical protein Y032_0024g908 [Ancylostoma ceylanicum]|uniref:Uncharacterized protein n=1 Tax=Ancylostoma ceylanicum TaxID=53326 RepID=A0A016UXN3_9BILA|nr:hypothetical protein Y032_0024g908 [Ancylostoma ceylanicum]